MFALVNKFRKQASNFQIRDQEELFKFGNYNKIFEIMWEASIKKLQKYIKKCWKQARKNFKIDQNQVLKKEFIFQ